jgi:hypothetical protein
MSLYNDIKSEFRVLYKEYLGREYAEQAGDNRAIGHLINKVNDDSVMASGGKLSSTEVLEEIKGLLSASFLYAPDWVKKSYRDKNGNVKDITLQLVNSEYYEIKSKWYPLWNKKKNYNGWGHKKVDSTQHSQGAVSMADMIGEIIGI